MKTRTSPGRMIGLLALALAAAALAVTASSGETPATAQEPPETDIPRTISVSGVGTANGTPDIAFIEIGVEIRNQDISAAVNEGNSTMQAVVDALIAQGIAEEDIQTSQFNVWQEESRPPDMVVPPAMPETSDMAETPPASDTPVPAPAQSQFTYVVTNTVRVRVAAIDQISAVIQTGLDAGANRVYGLSFGLDDPVALENEAREAAVADARARAEALAAAFGVQLGDPIQISEGMFGGGPQPLAFDAAGSVASGPVIREGQLTVSVQVNVVFALLP